MSLMDWHWGVLGATCDRHHGCQQVRGGGRADSSRVGFLQAACRGAETHETAEPQTERGARLHRVIACTVSAAVRYGWLSNDGGRRCDAAKSIHHAAASTSDADDALHEYEAAARTVR